MGTASFSTVDHTGLVIQAGFDGIEGPVGSFSIIWSFYSDQESVWFS